MEQPAAELSFSRAGTPGSSEAPARGRRTASEAGARGEAGNAGPDMRLGLRLEQRSSLRQLASGLQARLARAASDLQDSKIRRP